MNDRKKKHDQASRLAAAASLQKKLGLSTAARLNYTVAGSLEASAGNAAHAIHHFAEAGSAGAHSSRKVEHKKTEVKARAVEIKKSEQKPAADEGLRRSERLKAKAAAAAPPVKHIPTPKKPAAPQYVYADQRPATLTLYKPKPLVSSVDQRHAREDEGCCCFAF